MSYLTRDIIAQRVVEGVIVTIEEGLNYRDRLELRLDVPKNLWDYYDINQAALEFERKGPLYFAYEESSGLVRFFFYNGPGNGFGGREYRLRMKDGSTAVLKGPWSSNSDAMNKAGFEPSKEVNIKAQYNMASYLTHKRINELIGPLGYHCNSLNRIVPILKGA